MDLSGAAVWRPRLWVRVAAGAFLVVVVLSILFPQVLNPAWAEGTPSDQVPFAYGFLALALVLVWCTIRSRVEVTRDEMIVVNPWVTRRLAKGDVVEVRPGPFGVELLTEERRVVCLAVQTTGSFAGDRPRWVDVAELVTGETPDWRESTEDED